MAVKKYQFPITIGVHDPSLTVPAMRDEDGRIIRQSTVGVRYAAPGEWVEMEADEAQRIFDEWGTYSPGVAISRKPQIVHKSTVTPARVQK